MRVQRSHIHAQAQAYGAFHTFLDYPETLQISGIVVPQLAYVAQTTYVVHQPVRFVENGAP